MWVYDSVTKSCIVRLVYVFYSSRVSDNKEIVDNNTLMETLERYSAEDLITLKVKRDEKVYEIDLKLTSSVDPILNN